MVTIGIVNRNPNVIVDVSMPAKNNFAELKNIKMIILFQY